MYVVNNMCTLVKLLLLKKHFRELLPSENWLQPTRWVFTHASIPRNPEVAHETRSSLIILQGFKWVPTCSYDPQNAQTHPASHIPGVDKPQRPAVNDLCYMVN